MNNQMGEVLLICVGAYLVAGVPLGLVLVRLTHRGVDLRSVGTGNVGTSNIFRNLGPRLAAVVGPLQFAQGLVPVLVARGAGLGAEGLVAVAVCAVAGSGFSPYLRFRGGRAVAVATGAVAGLGIGGLVVLLVCYAAGLAGGRIAAGVILGFAVLPVAEAVALGAAGCAGALLVLALLLARRLEGVAADLHGHPRLPVLVERLVNDRRPGQTLVGRRIQR